MKAILLSIRPEHAYNIIKGRKTLELRKSVPKDYVGWVYCYITKGKRLSVVHDDENGETYYYLNSHWGRSLNQDIPFRFWFVEYAELNPNNFFSTKFLEEITQVSLEDMQKYSKGKYIYGWDIKKLEIFDKPMQLSDFNVKKHIEEYLKLYGEITYYEEELKRPPQSFQYVWVKEN